MEDELYKCAFCGSNYDYSFNLNEFISHLHLEHGWGNDYKKVESLLKQLEQKKNDLLEEEDRRKRIGKAITCSFPSCTSLDIKLLTIEVVTDFELRGRFCDEHRMLVKQLYNGLDKIDSDSCRGCY